MLVVTDAVATHGPLTVLSGCSFSLAPGELVALVGENGSGKSTLGKVVSGAQLVDGGTVLVDGHDPSISELERLRVRALVGRVCQDPNDQIVSPLVYDEIAFGPRNLGLTEAEVAQRVANALLLVGMTSYVMRCTSELSGGELQRIAIASVLAMRPSYIVFDEPTAQLDPAARSAIRQLIDNLAHEHGVGVMLITHDDAEIQLADRVVDMGRINTGCSRESQSLRSGDGGAAQGNLLHIHPATTRSDNRDVVLSVRDLGFSYGDRRVLRRLDLTLHRGDILMVSGSSGAGKSTLAALIAGLLEPESGTVSICGQPPLPGDVALAFQCPERQFFLDSVLDEISFAPLQLGCDHDGAERRAQKAAELVGLDCSLFGSSPFELSGGQARRVAMASVIAVDAPLYIFDEPSSGLDGSGRTFAHELMVKLANSGHAVMVITHDVDEWRPFVSDSLELHDGALRPLCDGTAGPRLPRSALEEDLGLHHGPLDSLIAPEKACKAPDDRVSHQSPGSSRRARGGQSAALGEYVPDTPAARVDARVKIVLLLIATAGVFSARSLFGSFAWGGMLLVCLRASRMSLGRVLRGLRPVALVLAFTLVANLVSCDGGGAVPLAGTVGIDPAGGMRGLLAVCRILLLVGFSLAVASSTTGTQLSDACVRLLRPAARLGFPVAALGTVLSLALRFVPLVSEEMGRIRLAQRARGVHFDEGSMTERIAVWSSVLTPLVVGLFRRADQLADAMSARCYGAVAAGCLPAPRRLSTHDRMVLAGGVALAIALTALGLLW